VLAVAAVALGLSVNAAGGRDSIASDDLRQWLTYIASDELKGRAVYTDELSRAAGFLQQQLSRWDVTPGGDGGTFLQSVRVQAVKAVSRSSVTVRVGSMSRTFKDGDGVYFPPNSGGRRTVSFDRVEFVGYGLDVPGLGHTDFKGRDVRGAVVVWLGANGPRDLEGQRYRRLMANRSRHAVDQLGAGATIGPRRTGFSRTGGRSGAPDAPDFTTAERLDRHTPPAVTAADAFFEFLFGGAPARYDDLRRRAERQEPLPTFRLKNVRITFNVDADYTVVRTDLTENVVAIVEGRDPRLKSTYVAFGAHYDHVGAIEPKDDHGQRPANPGFVTPTAPDDRIWNGADDDGSGTVVLLALARAFAEGPRPKRSLLFVWHAGEERGLYGSRYYADRPTVPLDSIVGHLNLDMVGRNRSDLASEANTVYLVGSDRISTELHQVSQDANRSLPQPMRLDYEMNDPADPEQIYYRSDHYSYAAKGIPVIFFTTGLHPDYHANTDEVSKIEFAKMARIGQLVYETGLRLANLDHRPVRDFKGPRAGKE
jgi:hypothetical protein